MKKILALIFVLAFGVTTLAMAEEQAPATGSAPAASAGQTPAPAAQAPAAKKAKKTKKTKHVKKMKKEETKPVPTPAA